MLGGVRAQALSFQSGQRATPRGSRHLQCLCAARCRSVDEARCFDYPSRRAALACLGAAALFSPPEAGANVLQDYVERSQRPEMTSEQAVVMLLDARGVLSELRALASTAPNSEERFRARALLPGMAKRLRQVGQAAPVVVAEATGGDKRMTISKLYGGKGDETAIAVPIYQAIGQVITISGRTIKKEAQASPEFAETAIQRINELLDLLPEGELSRAESLREARRESGFQIKRKDVPSNALA